MSGQPISSMQAGAAAQAASQPTFTEGLRRIHAAFPVKALVHVGAGGAPNSVPYEAWGVSEAVLIEPVEENVHGLDEVSTSRPGWKFVSAYVSGHEGEADFCILRPRNECSLLTQEAIQDIWSKPTAVESIRVRTRTVDSILADQALSASANWLLISCLPALPILSGSTHVLRSIDVVAVRVVLEQTKVIDSSTSKSAIDSFLGTCGFTCAMVSEELNPKIGLAVYVRHQQDSEQILDLLEVPALPAQILAMAHNCFSRPDVLDAIDDLLFSGELSESDRFLFYIALADRFVAEDNKMVALGLLQTARDHLPAVPGRSRTLIAQRLIDLGEQEEAMDMLARLYLSTTPGITLGDKSRQALVGAYEKLYVQSKRSSQHGHDLLLSHLGSHIHKFTAREGARRRVLIEVGTTRENVPGQGSTRQIADFCIRHGLHFITVDMDPHNSRMAQDMFARMGAPFEAITMKGEDYLRDYSGTFDFVFLDAYDFDHGKHTDLRQSRYIKLLGAPISDAACHQMHLDCAHSIIDKLSDDGIVCFDDTWIEKGKWVAKGETAMPYLLEHGFDVVEARNRAALLVRK